jgi:SulP family sulfate permease
LFGGVTATIVALPVALAFGVASGLGPEAGIYGAIAVGFFAAVFGGTPSQISGPTGPMTVAMAVVVTQYTQGDPVEAFTVVILGGLFQIALGLMRIGRFVSYTPYSVISGFMTGIGVIIIIIQVLPFLGIEPVPGGPVAVILAWPSLLGSFNTDAIIVALIALAIGFAWRGRPARYVPGPLVALVAGSLVGVLWLNGAPTIGDIPRGLPEFHIPVVSLDFILRVIQPALILALLGSIDSLLTSLIADSITRTRHKPNKELVGQGIGNMASGFIGGLPGAGATLGTVVSIRAGGRSPLAGVLRSLALFALVLGLGWVVEPIPLAVLAAVLMKVGWDIMDWRFVTRLHQMPREHLVVMLMTFVLTVFLDLVTAIAIGLIAAGMASARLLERQELDSVVSVPLLDQAFLSPELDADQDDAFSARVGLVSMRGRFSVASSSNLVSAIGQDIQEHEVVIFDFSETLYMDDSAAMVVEQMIDIASEEDTESIVMGLSGSPVENHLHALNTLHRVPEDRFVDNLDGAREVAQRILNIEPEPVEHPPPA